MEESKEIKEIVKRDNENHIIKTICIEDLEIPLKMRENVSVDVENLNKIDENVNCFTKDKQFHDEVLNSWVERYGFKRDYVFDVAFTGVVKIDDGCKIFLLYCVEKEDENSYVEIDVTFDKNIENDINKILLLILSK